MAIITVSFDGESPDTVIHAQKVYFRHVKSQLNPGDDTADPVVPPDDHTAVTAAHIQTYLNSDMVKVWDKIDSREHMDKRTPTSFR